MTTTRFGVNINSIRAAVGEALTYWGTALISVLPKAVQNRLEVGEELLLICQAQDGVRLLDSVNGKVTELAHFTQAGELLDEGLIDAVKKHLNKDKQLYLVVSDDSVLSKRIDFPAAGIDNLHQALLYEMDKYTPFPTADILFDAVVEHQHAAKAQVGLYILHRSQVQTLLSACQQAKIPLDRICSQSRQEINLLPEALRRKRAIFPHKRNLLLGVTTLALLLGCLALPLYFKRATAIALEAQMAQLSEQAQGEGELWEKRDAAEAVIVDFVNAYPMPFLQIYEALSKTLPDDTWLTTISFTKGKFNIRGEGHDAAGLIAIINGHPYFKSARIASPIIKSRQDSDKEVFNITFESVTKTSEGEQ